MKENPDLAEFATSATTMSAARHAATSVADEPQGDARESEGQELIAWLKSARSFFNPRNHPFTDAEAAEITTRDWSAETRIARSTLLRCTERTLALVEHNTRPAPELTTVAEMFDDDAAGSALRIDPASGADAELNRSVSLLAASLGDVTILCASLLKLREVDFEEWATVGKILTREILRAEEQTNLQLISRHSLAASLHPSLLALTENLQPETLAEDLRIVFSQLSQLLTRLRHVENLLRRDQPLKVTLPLFTLVHEEARRLLEFIEGRAMRAGDLEQSVVDALDSTSYAIGMELRKVFAHELVGLSRSRQAPLIYAKIENSHGLLRDSFQQSVVTLAQIFDPELDPARLFDIFQTKLDQSIALRESLWALLQLVRQAEREREGQPVAALLERLADFRTGAMRYLMYKDWEAYERFVEEATLARGAIELAPVLHRFGTYLETLFSQINMRAVLADHPFDNSAGES